MDEKFKEVQAPKAVEKVLKELKDIMPTELPKRLPPRTEVSHAIELESGAKLLVFAPYCMASPELEKLSRQLKKLFNVGYICPSKSPYGALVLCLKKHDESLQLCIDYWVFNKIHMKNK